MEVGAVRLSVHLALCQNNSTEGNRGGRDSQLTDGQERKVDGDISAPQFFQHPLPSLLLITSVFALFQHFVGVGRKMGSYYLGTG